MAEGLDWPATSISVQQTRSYGGSAAAAWRRGCPAL